MAEIQEILEIQTKLLTADAQLREQKLEEFTETLKKTLADPETMFLGLNVLQNEETRQLMAANPAVSAQIKLLSEPSIAQLEQTGDESIRENARLVLLVQKAQSANAASISELVSALGIKGDPALATKAVQKLVMRAIQLNIMQATIDKKTDTVYFM